MSVYDDEGDRWVVVNLPRQYGRGRVIVNGRYEGPSGSDDDLIIVDDPVKPGGTNPTMFATTVARAFGVPAALIPETGVVDQRKAAKRRQDEFLRGRERQSWKARR